MRLKKLALVSLIGLPLLAATTAANADARFWRHAATLGATSGSFYTTSRDDHKIVAATQDDASSYLASNARSAARTWKPRCATCAPPSRACRPATTTSPCVS